MEANTIQCVQYVRQIVVERAPEQNSNRHGGSPGQAIGYGERAARDGVPRS